MYNFVVYYTSCFLFFRISSQLHWVELKLSLAYNTDALCERGRKSTLDGDY